VKHDDIDTIEVSGDARQEKGSVYRNAVGSRGNGLNGRTAQSGRDAWRYITRKDMTRGALSKAQPKTGGGANNITQKKRNERDVSRNLVVEQPGAQAGEKIKEVEKSRCSSGQGTNGRKGDMR